MRPREDPARPQQGARQAHDLVDGLARHLAHQVGEGPQQGADHDAQHHVREQRGTRVDEHGVDGAGLVDPVGVDDGASRAVDGAAFAGGGLGVAERGVGGDQDGVSCRVCAPAQVDVVAHQGQRPVEAAEFVPHVAADQHAGGRDRQDGPDLVVLALVLFAPVETGPAAAAVGDGDADFEELFTVVPAAQLGPDDARVRADVGDPQQFGQRAGVGRAVVVEQPEPLHGLAVREFGQVVAVVAPAARDRVPAAGALEIGQVVGAQHGGGADGLVDGGAEAGAAGEVQDAFVAERFGDQARGVVGAAGVGGVRVLYGAFLAEQSGQDVGEPACAVVRDDDGGHHMAGEFGSHGRLVRGRRLAVHGHRGTGPPPRKAAVRTAVGAAGGARRALT